MKLGMKQIQAWQTAKKNQLLPIVYLRGFAMGDSEIDDTTADPFNGFNVGSVLVRTGWTGTSSRHIFESPVLRLTQPPYNYRLAFSDGIKGLSTDTKQELSDWKSFLENPDNAAASWPPNAVIAICRYYDIDSHLLGEGHRVGMETYGWGVGRLILDLLDATGASGVYLVAHSMGGLVARTFLQNEEVLQSTSHPGDSAQFATVDSLVSANPALGIVPADWTRARHAVRRFFTYGTPHNGITGQGGLGNALVGAIGTLIGFEIGNFDRKNIKRYLNTMAANSLGPTFPIENTFCLVGTGSADYPVAGGFSRRLVGQRSDGLVEVDNAVVYGPTPGSTTGETTLAARAYVRRAHSGPYGMVNSEEGFGNLSRFLYGDVRVDADLKVTRIDLPQTLQERKDAAPPGTVKINASYSFEVFLRVRGENWAMTERLVQDGAAIFRRYDELFPAVPVPADGVPASQLANRDKHQRVELFTAFLDTALRTKAAEEDVGGTMRADTLGFALRLRVIVPDYEVDGTLWRQDHYEGSSLLDRDWVFVAFPDPAEGWGLAWGPNRPGGDNSKLEVVKPSPMSDPEQGDAAFTRTLSDAIEFWLPVREGPPTFKAWLRLTARARSG